MTMWQRDIGNGPEDSGCTRRGALCSIVGAASVTAFSLADSTAPAAQGAGFSPEMFGAVGDGRTDDYDAFMRLASAVNAAGGGVIRFGPGRQYRIDRIHVTGGPQRNAVSHIVFERCRGLHIDLNGSTIHVKGDFHRSANGRGRASDYSAVIPLMFNRCSDLRIENGTLDGHVGEMSRDPQVAEFAGHGIAINGCQRVVLERLHVHHFSTDGVCLSISRGDERPCQDIRLNRMLLNNNARMGLTNGGASGVLAVDCSFSENGLTGSPYRHAPSSGVDIEPIRRSPIRSDFRAIRCRFDANVGYPVAAASPDFVSSVELIDCSATAPTQRRMILAAERTVVRGGSWHNIQIACAYAAHRPFEHPVSIDVSAGNWTGNDPRWCPVYDLSPRRPNVRIHGNRFELRSREPFVPFALFQCANPNHRFEDNQIFVSRTGHDRAGDDLIAQFQGAALVRGNRWTTDLRPPGRFINNYAGVATAEREIFSGSFVQIGR